MCNCICAKSTALRDNANIPFGSVDPNNISTSVTKYCLCLMSKLVNDIIGNSIFYIRYITCCQEVLQCGVYLLIRYGGILKPSNMQWFYILGSLLLLNTNVCIDAVHRIVYCTSYYTDPPRNVVCYVFCKLIG